MIARALVIGLSALALAGCYGSTEPATEVGPETAKLNARGAADNGPASSYFQYWQAGGPVSATSPLQWPAGAAGAFSQMAQGLRAGATYSFRVCGSDDGQAQRACAQTRTFKTGPPVEDSVTGSWSFSPHYTGEIDASSGPAGQNAKGSVDSLYAPSSYSRFTGFVTCLVVHGNRAAVGAVGHERVEPSGPGQPATLLVTVVDNSPAGADTIGRRFAYGSTRPDCGAASFDQQLSLGQGAEDLVVNDAP